DKQSVIDALTHCRDMLAQGAKPDLPDLAASLWQASRSREPSGTGRSGPARLAGPTESQPTLAVVATSLDDLKEKLDVALKQLPGANGRWHDPRGLYWVETPAPPGKVAFLFPGQGSQYPNMLAQAAMAFPEVRETLDPAA